MILREISKAKENKSDLIKSRRVVKELTLPITTNIIFENRSNLINEENCEIVDENACHVLDKKLADVAPPPVPTKILFEKIKFEPVEEILPDIIIDDDPLSTEKLSALNNLQVPYKFSVRFFY